MSKNNFSHKKMPSNNYIHNYNNNNNINININNNNNNNNININNNNMNNLIENQNCNPKTIMIRKKLNSNPNIKVDINNMKIDNININKNKHHKGISKKKNEFLKKKELEKIKKENELEEQIKDHLKCYICLCQVTKPKMCMYCKRICCEQCINKWLENHSFCGICKHQLSVNDMIDIPFLDNISSFFINNIENNPKKQIINKEESYKKLKNNGPIKILDNKRKDKNNMNNIYNTISINDINNTNSIIENNNSTIINEDEDICMEHGNNIEYYCIQCNKYFCGQCLIFFGSEVNKHNNHFIIKANKMNDSRIKEITNEYQKLPETKNKITDLIGLCNLKLKEYEIKKYEIIKSMNLIKDYYMNMIENNSEDIKQSLEIIKHHKNNFDNNKNKILNKLSNNNNNNNDYKKVVPQIIKEFQNLGINPQLDNQLNKKISLEKTKSPKLFLENYQTNFVNYNNLQFNSGHFHENQILVDYNIYIIQGNNCKLNIKYSHNKAIISFQADIRMNQNSDNFTKFYAYVIFKHDKYGLEFIHLYENNNIDKSKQINSNEIDINKFLFLCDEEQKKICFNVCITKTFYKYHD